jgi:hypothetical protein
MRKPSPALIVALAALFVALGGVGVAANGQNLILGKPDNSATLKTGLSVPVNDKALQLTNTNTGTSATALGLTVASGHAPFTVSSQTRVANLNADQLDGLDSAAFARAKPAQWNIITGTTQNTVLTPGKFVCYPEGASGQYDECWVNYGSPLSTAAYAKDAFGFVHLKGVVKCPPASGTSFGSRPCEKADPTNVIFVLPPGFRPAETSVFSSVSNNAFGRVTVDASGKVIAEVGDVYTLDNDGWIALDGITFRAA